MRPDLTLFVLLIFSIPFFKFSSYCMGTNLTFCAEIEKEALLSFKQSLQDPNNTLSSWDAQLNCCNWKGVVCNNLTGHVHQLQLQSHGLFGKMNPSLLNLTHLRYLDLSQNNFNQTIPSLVGSLRSLEYLNLSQAGFHGRIPYTIGNLSKLRTLSLEDDYVSLMSVDSLEWLLGLSHLEHLNMNSVNLSKAGANWAQVINSLPSLVELHFSSCGLNIMDGIDHQLNMTTSLQLLDLSHNDIRSVVPRWIFKISQLIFLDLSDNSFEGPIPSSSNTTKLQHINLLNNHLINSTIPYWIYSCKDLEFVHFKNNLLHGTISNAIANLTSLRMLDLSGNGLSGKLPREIASLCQMQTLQLNDNELDGEISDSFGNMSDCFLASLESLSLRANQLSGHLTNQFGEFKRLETLSFRANSLSGTIPSTLQKLSSLKDLSLGSNKLTGNLPESLGQLYNLDYLNIEDNMLEGVVSETHFANLTKLTKLYASKNLLTLKVSPNWFPPFKLASLWLGSWNLGSGSKIPSWLHTQKNILQELDLSGTGISTSIPSWFWRIGFLDLSHNQLSGRIRYIVGPKNGTHGLMYLGSNQFTGSLPLVGNTVTELDLSNNSFTGGISHFLGEMMAANQTAYRMEILHLGENQLTGQVPDCWMKWPSLRYLNLGGNNLSGSIPHSIGHLADLWSLNLYSNRFSGQIPSSIHNCTKLAKIDLSGNELDGNMPTWMGTRFSSLRILILRSNKLSGRLSSDICGLNSLQILDLSDNRFSGTIPRCVDNFTAMATERRLPKFGQWEYSLSYYWDFFIERASVTTKGREQLYDTILSLVTIIDLSKNFFYGDIPKELTSLVELRSLNLSRNRLTGLIPNTIGDMKELESLDFSRNSLFGEIPNSFTIMSSLNYLNLSYNNLTGRIPESTQLLGFNASSFIGNNLCGPPLTCNCSDDGVEIPKTAYKDDDDDDDDDEGDEFAKREWFYYLFVTLGYAVGFSAVCTTLAFKKSWREAYFGFVEKMWNNISAYAYIKWTRLANHQVQIHAGRHE